ncbi:MAG: UDP-N-acetylmuramate dehydrogenase [Ignavibacteriae bacterium]|nr:UDP-N-acetylmuramate dehydrogenase [Ignavibacteriota bacterium]
MFVIEDIQQYYRGRIALNEPLSKYTSYRIGGPADFYFEPADKDDVIALVQHLHEKSIRFFVIGNGSNLLVSDNGVRGVVLNLERGLNQIRTDGEIVYAEAGARLTKFVDFCIQLGLQGVEMLAGIPGTVGGGVIMNAGAYGGEISDFLTEVEVIREGKVLNIKKEAAQFAYRRSGLVRDVVVSASFNLQQGDKAEMMKRRRELLIKRNESQPLNFPNSGSIFKNPVGNYAAKLIEQSGLKGTMQGHAQISEKHGNFIVNTGGAFAQDVIGLMRLARKTVLEKFGITLEPEVKLIGFTEDIVKEFCN